MTQLGEIISRAFLRDELADILVDYNRTMGNDSAAYNNIVRLRENTSVCVFTGQQLGYMGGPAYTLYKAVGCLQTAQQLNAVPIFWLATEDHDIAEIDHTYTVNDLGNIQKHKLTLASSGIVEDLVLSEENVSEIHEFCLHAGIKGPKHICTAGDLYVEVMTRLLVEKFRGTGMVFMEPRLVRHRAKELFLREICDCREIRRVLEQSSERLKNAGMETPIEFRDQGTNLFYKDCEGKRQKVDCINGEFQVGAEKFSKKQLVELVHQEPSAFSSNVALRPLIQSYLFPTIAYIGGPTELRYFEQLKDYFRYHKIPMPQVVPRPSVTCLNTACKKYLNMANLQPSDAIPDDWALIFSEAVGKDKKEVKNLLQEKGIVYNALHYLQNFLHPFNAPQERALNWLWFDAQADEPLLKKLLASSAVKTRNHHYLNLVESTHE